MKSLYLMVLLLSFGGLVYPPSVMSQTESKPEWKYIVTSEDDNQVWKTYCDLKRIKQTVEGTVEVWLKQVPITKTGKERRKLIHSIIENRTLNKIPINGYEKFAYSLTLIEFDCGKNLARSVSIEDYDETAKLLGSDTIEGVPFAPVREGSATGVILEAVCKSVNKEMRVARLR
jgi:hypothetical protein